MTFEIPLFPLNLVLFPGMPLPLHIFEPRYRVMMRRVLDGDSTFGVALIMEGIEGQPGTLPMPVGCTARITSAAELPDGRLNLHCEGSRRFRVLSLREEDDYVIGTVEWLDDEMLLGDERAEARDLRRALAMRLINYLALVAPHSQLAVSELEIPRDAEELSYWIAMLLPIPNGHKQTLLELSSTLERLRMELKLLNRAHVVHHAFARRNLYLKAASSESETADDSFVWMN